MRTIHVSQAGCHYFINGSYWGDAAEGALMCLRGKSVSPDEIAKEGVEKGRLPPLLGYVFFHVV